MTITRLLVLSFAACFASAPAAAADIVGARYNAADDELVVDVVYQGTRPGHEFAVEWGRCFTESTPPGVTARLVDLQGGDVAREEYRARARIGLQGMPCRPAEVTLKLGKVSQASVFVPGR